jgi:hypothetical protein
MATKDSSNKQLLRKLQKQADELGCIAASERLPVRLKTIAERRRVTSVEFVTMPVRAMLTTHPKGFRVFLKTDDDEQAMELKRRYDDKEQERPLPIKFRFSLAHELAHTLFYELGTPDERPKTIREFRAGGGKTILENLEKYCNRIAGHLLMPSPFFRTEMLKLKSLQPRELLAFAERAEASVESVVARLGEEDGVFLHHDLRGCVAAIRKTAKGFFVRSIAKPRSLNIAKEIRSIQSGEEWQVTTDSGQPTMDGGAAEQMKIHLTIETRLSSKKVEHALDVLRYSSFEHGESYLLHLAAVEPAN